MRLAFFIFRLAIVLLLAGRAFAATEIPFAARDGMVWVKVSAAGCAEPLHFLLDSGASVSVLDLSAARRMGARLGDSQKVQGVHGRATAYRLPKFDGQIGGAKLPGSIIALDLSPVSAACHRRIDGLLGADFFRGRIVQIDYAAGKIRFLSEGEIDAGGHEAIPLSTRDGVLCVRVSVAGSKPAWTRVDTGCDSALEWVFAPAPAAKPIVASIGLAAGRSPFISADVQLGAERFTGVKVGVHRRPIFAGEAGLLGNGLLSRFASVTFDPAGKRLLVAKR